MKQPDIDDRLVNVTAYLTDEIFGHDHWRAAQFAPSPSDHQREALLVICKDGTERDYLRKQVEAALTPETQQAVDAQQQYESYLLLFRRDLRAVLLYALRSGRLPDGTRMTVADLCDALLAD